MKIELENVEKNFKGKKVLMNISVSFVPDKIYGIVGSNGSGKSVLLKLIAGIYRASKGTIKYGEKVLKKDIDFLPSLGLIIEKPGFFDDLSGIDNLRILSSINNTVGENEIKETLKKVGLEITNLPVAKYSLGMKQRLGLAQAIMENPKVLILDEFSTGLDTEGVELAHSIIMEHKTEDNIVIITSHSIYDIESLCDKVFEIKEGILYEKK